MIRFKLKQLVADKEFKERRVVPLSEIAAATGIHRTTLSKIANEVPCTTVTDNVDKLCVYFGCTVSDVMEHVEDDH